MRCAVALAENVVMEKEFQLLIIIIIIRKCNNKQNQCIIKAFKYNYFSRLRRFHLVI